MKRRTFSFGLLASGLSTALTSRSAFAGSAPSIIRIGYPSVGIGNRPIVGGSPAGTVHLRGLLEEEFKAEGIKIQWNFLRGAGPAVNELFANGLADFGFGLGDLPSIIGHSGGLKTRISRRRAFAKTLTLPCLPTLPSPTSRSCAARRYPSRRARISSLRLPRFWTGTA